MQSTILKICSLKSVQAQVLYSKAHIYRLIDAGLFPAPIKLNPTSRGKIAFNQSEIDDWLIGHGAKPLPLTIAAGE